METSRDADSLQDDPVPSQQVLRRFLIWLGLAALALIVFELTADPALTVAVGCLEYAFKGLRAALSTLRTEPDPARRRARALFLVAWGLWKTTAAALLTMVVVAVGYHWILRIQGRPPLVDAPGEFISAVLVALSGGVVATLVTLLGIISARRHRVRVWVGGARNRVPLIATLGLIGLVMALSVAIVWGPLVLPPEAGWWIPVMVCVEIGYFFLALPIAVLRARDGLVGRITARWPGE